MGLFVQHKRIAAKWMWRNGLDCMEWIRKANSHLQLKSPWCIFYYPYGLHTIVSFPADHTHTHVARTFTCRHKNTYTCTTFSKITTKHFHPAFLTLPKSQRQGQTHSLSCLLSAQKFQLESACVFVADLEVFPRLNEFSVYCPLFVVVDGTSNATAAQAHPHTMHNALRAVNIYIRSNW